LNAYRGLRLQAEHDLLVASTERALLKELNHTSTNGPNVIDHLKSSFFEAWPE